MFQIRCFIVLNSVGRTSCNKTVKGLTESKTNVVVKMSEEGAQADVASYRRYTAKDLHYRFELEDLVKAEENFNIISVYKHNFAIVDIIPRMTGRDQIFWILEDCYECAEEFDGVY